MNIQIRKCEQSDMGQVIDLLKENMSSFAPPQSEYEKIWNEYRLQNNVFSLVACLDEKIIGYGAVLIEIKLRGGRMAHIEDIVSSSSFRRMGVGSKILEGLLSIANKHNCYKAMLACEDHVIDFYIANGYVKNGYSMKQYLKKSI